MSQTNWYNLFSQNNLYPWKAVYCPEPQKYVYASPCDLISNKCEVRRVWGVWGPTHRPVTGHFLIWVTSPTLTQLSVPPSHGPTSQMASDGAKWDVTIQTPANQRLVRRGVDQSEASMASVITRCHVSRVTICCDTHYLSQMSRGRHWVLRLC